MADDKLAQEAHEALLDMIQWVAAFAKGAGSHKLVMASPRMLKALAVLEKLALADGVQASGEARPIAVQHMELPAIVVCKPCKDAASGVRGLDDAQR